MISIAGTPSVLYASTNPVVVEDAQTTAGGFSDYQVRLWMDDFCATQLWAAVLVASPESVADPLLAEVGGAAYQRPKMALRRVNARMAVNAGPLAFLGLPSFTTVYAIGAFDAPFNGNLRASILLPAGLEPSFLGGGSYTLAAEEVFFGIR